MTKHPGTVPSFYTSVIRAFDAKHKPKDEPILAAKLEDIIKDVIDEFDFEYKDGNSNHARYISHNTNDFVIIFQASRDVYELFTTRKSFKVVMPSDRLVDTLRKELTV